MSPSRISLSVCPAICVSVVAIGLFARPAVLSADNWPQWRGAEGNSVSRETGIPLTWGEGANIAWKTPIPEWGTSSPSIWGNALFITAETDGKLLLLKLDKTGGAVEWTREVGSGIANRKQPQGENRAPKFHELHNLASPTAALDGERAIVHFGNGELASYKFDGTLEWRRNLADDFGRYTIWWGHANSPILYENLVISVCMQDSLKGLKPDLAPSYVVAHDKRTGELVWKSDRMTTADAEQCDSYTSPVFARVGGRTEMIVMGGNQLDSYDPATGRQLWSLPGLVGGRTITGPTVAGNIVVTTVGMRGPMTAVRLDGSSEGVLAAEDSIAWKNTDSTPDTCCPVVWNDLLFSVADNGVATCIESGSGKVLWKQRLGGDFKSTPVAAEGRIYFVNRAGTCTVVKAD
ncbi:MAG: PQQ-binding-like beta-propeller repeat protein, partial [Planctomycetaceae bacterium]